MLTRRHLFRTLSAIALAPLAKLVPKEEPTEVPWRRQTLILKYPSIEVDESLIRVIRGPLQWPVPQEEA